MAPDKLLGEVRAYVFEHWHEFTHKGGEPKFGLIVEHREIANEGTEDSYRISYLKHLKTGRSFGMIWDDQTRDCIGPCSPEDIVKVTWEEVK